MAKKQVEVESVYWAYTSELLFRHWRRSGLELKQGKIPEAGTYAEDMEGSY